MSAVEMEHYTKKLKGKTILSDITLKLEAGTVSGFYGRNGSGKSMLFRAVSGLIHPTEGFVRVFGKKLGEDVSFPDSMGLVIESVGFWPYYTGFENLKILASILKDSDIFTSDAKVFQAYRECRKKIFAFLRLGQK